MDSWEVLQSFLSYLPRIVFISLVLLLGYISGNIVERLVHNLAEAIGIKRHLRFGVERELKRYGFSANLLELFGKFLKYIIYLVAIIIVFDMLGLSIAEKTLVPLLLYSPNVVAAFLIVAIGAILTEFASDIIRFRLQEYGLDGIAKESGMKVRLSAIVALFLKYFLYIVILVMAMAQLGFQVLSVIILISIFWFILTVTAASLLIFGTKEFFPNLMTGLYIKSTGCFKKDDMVETGGVKGRVTQIGLIVTEISSGKKVHRVPNSVILKSGYSILKRR